MGRIRVVIGRLPQMGLALLAGLLLAAAALGAARADPVWPALTGRIVDQANIVTPAARAAILPKLVDLEDKSGIQLVVATVPSLQDTDIETFANGLFRAWKLGEEKKNNGLLLLVAPNERKVRIEVGYGLEGTMTDALSKVIIQSAIVPSFKAGDFSAGVTKGVDAIIGALTVDAAEWQRKTKVRVDKQADPIDQILPFIVFALFFFVIVSMIRNARGQSGRWVRVGNRTIFIPGPPTGGGWGGGSGGGSSGGGWSGGGSDSGGFSGGGGSSGGGGASGDW